MTTHVAKTPVTNIVLTYVLSGSQLYFVNNQRIAAAAIGAGVEPALADSVVQVFSATHEFDNIYPGPVTTLAFDTDGLVRQDISQQARLATLKGLDPTTYIQQWRSEDEVVLRYLEIAKTCLDAEKLLELLDSAIELPRTVGEVPT